MNREQSKIVSRVISGALAVVTVGAMIAGAVVKTYAADVENDIFNGIEINANTKIWAGSSIFIASSNGKSIVWGRDADSIKTDLSKADIKDVDIDGKQIYILADFEGDQYEGYRLFSNEDGKFGSTSDELKIVAGMEDVEVKQFDIASKHGIALDDQNRVWTWGTNENGCLGEGEVGSVKELGNKEFTDKIKRVGTGNFYSMILFENGTVSFTGTNYGITCLESEREFNGWTDIPVDKYITNQEKYKNIIDAEFGDTYVIMELSDGHYIVGNHNYTNSRKINNGSITEYKLEGTDSKYTDVTDGGDSARLAFRKNSSSYWHFIENDGSEVIDSKANIEQVAMNGFLIIAIGKDANGKYRLAAKGSLGNMNLGFSADEVKYFRGLDNGKYIYDEINRFEITNANVKENIVNLKKNESITFTANVFPTDFQNMLKVRIVDDSANILKIANDRTVLATDAGHAQIEVYLDGFEKDYSERIFVTVDSKDAADDKELILTTQNDGKEYVKVGIPGQIKIKVKQGDASKITGFTYSVVTGSGIEIKDIIKSGEDWVIVVNGWNEGSQVVAKVTEKSTGASFVFDISCVKAFPDKYNDGNNGGNSGNIGDNRIAKSLSYSFTEKNYEVGEKFVVEYPDATPYNAYKAWEVKVEDGLLKSGDYYVGNKAGTYTITVTEKISKLSASYKVNIKEKSVTELKLPDEVEIIYGENNEIKYELPSSKYSVRVVYAPSQIRYEIDNLSQIIYIGVKSRDIIDTTQPLFIGISDGADYNVEKVIRLNVVEKSVSGVKIVENSNLDEETGLIMTVGTTEQLNVTTLNNDTSSLKWSSSNRNVARVDSFGNVYAMRSGTCVIKVEDTNRRGYEDSIKITVMTDSEKEKYFDKESTKINILNEKFEVGVGEKVGILYEIIHLNGYDQLHFETEDDTISVTSGGVITGLKVGKGQVRIYSDSKTYDTLIDVEVKYGEKYWNDTRVSTDMYSNQPIIVTLTQNIGAGELKNGEVFISADKNGNEEILSTNASVKGNKITISLTGENNIEFDKDYYIFVDMLGLHVRMQFRWHK